MRRTISFLFTTSAMVLIIGVFITWARDTRAQNQLGNIELQVTGFASSEGQSCASLFNSPEGYPTQPEKALLRRCAPIREKRSTIIFENLPFGSYAAFAFHDRDNNNEILQSRIGIPREPMGASKNARGRFGPPSFEDAAFRHQSPKTLVPMAVREL